MSLIEAYNSNNLEAARSLQQQSIDMIRLLGKYGGIATGKAYMKMIGMDCGEFRLPISNMSDAQFDLFSADVDALGFAAYASKNPK
jgi:N-acetylneuraminate lyase